MLHKDNCLGEKGSKNFQAIAKYQERDSEDPNIVMRTILIPAWISLRTIWANLTYELPVRKHKDETCMT